MPRPLLKIWREQNRDREPSSLLTVPSHDALRRMQQSASMEGLRKFAETAPARDILVDLYDAGSVTQPSAAMR
jgi:hypothetical protein